MSIVLFEDVLARAIAMFLVNSDKPLLKGADLSLYLDIKDVRNNFKNLGHYLIVRANIEMEGIFIPSQSSSRGDGKSLRGYMWNWMLQLRLS